MTPETCQSPDTLAIKAGTEEAQAVNVARIKPLEWEERSGSFYTVTALGDVAIEDNGENICIFENSRKHDDFSSIEAAKSFVQNNHERYVSDWLLPAPSLPQDVAAQVEWLLIEADLVDQTANAYKPGIARDAMQDKANFTRQIAATLGSQSSTIASAREVIEQLQPAAETVMAGLDARIDEAIAKGGTAVPVFNGIGDLHDAIGVSEPEPVAHDVETIAKHWIEHGRTDSFGQPQPGDWEHIKANKPFAYSEAIRVAKWAISALAKPVPTPGGAVEALRMPTDPEWYAKKAELEGDLEVGAGFSLTGTINPSPEQRAEYEHLAMEALPEWARKEIETLRALSHPAEGWRDIESAPKDGTVIQAWHMVHKCPVSVLWKEDGFPYKGERLNWYERSYTTAWPERAFTHWRPLPAAPLAARAEGE